MDALNAFEQEIRELESKLEEKKQELRDAGVERHEREVFRDVVREHAATAAPRAATAPSPRTAARRSQAAGAIPPDRERLLNTFVEHAFTKGIGSAVAEARKMQDPYLLDLLHDRLADEYYDKLVAARKVMDH